MKKRTTKADNAKKHIQEVLSEDRYYQEIRRRAYELYEQRGREHGRDFEDWLAAEEELANTGK